MSFDYMRGINLGGWLSQCEHNEEHYISFITEEDIKTVKSYGADHVRLPIDYNLVEDNEGNYKEEGFSHINDAVSWCKKYGLKLILDVHKTFGYSFYDGYGEDGFFENEGYQERFYRLWEELAKRYGSLNDMLAFELLNEVTLKDYCDIWNKIAKKAVERIRPFAPKTYILYGGYWNNSVDAVKDLCDPFDDYIVYNFHCYEPLVFTHQGAPWIPTMDTSFRMPFMSTYGEYADSSKVQVGAQYSSLKCFENRDLKPSSDYFSALFEEAVNKAAKLNVPLYCGEYGVIDRAAPEDTVLWYKTINEVFEKNNIGRACWSYKEMDFGISDSRLDNVRSELLKYI